MKTNAFARVLQASFPGVSDAALATHSKIVDKPNPFTAWDFPSPPPE
jgi:hypothetical protein